MAQHDYIIDSRSGLITRNDINNALEAITTLNSGTSAPSTTYAGMFWQDTNTTPAILKIRNSADSAWLNFLDVISDDNFYTGVPAGFVINVTTSTGSTSTFTTTDNTYQNADTISYTPKASGNKLYISVFSRLRSTYDYGSSEVDANVGSFGQITVGGTQIKEIFQSTRGRSDSAGLSYIDTTPALEGVFTTSSTSALTINYDVKSQTSGHNTQVSASATNPYYIKITEVKG